METGDLIASRRTIRLFQQKPVPYGMLEPIVDAARLAPTARNAQPLEFIAVDSDGPLSGMFDCMGMGGELSRDSFQGKEPMAYIVILVNKEIETKWTQYDAGIASQNIMLSAWGQGIGSCLLAKINRDGIRELLNVPVSYEIDLVVALGYPAEQSVAEDARPGTEMHYYRDKDGRLHIPKRRLKDVLHRNSF
jgi:nitroreductase